MSDGRLGSPGRRIKVSALIQNALALMLSSAGTAALGLVFWGLAARRASASDVGRASAEIAAMVLLADLAQLSFTSVFDRFLAVTGDRTRRFVRGTYAVCMVLALCIGTIYVLAGFSSKAIPSGFGWRALFVASVIFWTIFVLQDSVLTGLRAARWVPVENILFGVAKIALLPLFLIVVPHQAIFLAWTVPVVFATIIVNWYLFNRRIPQHEREWPSSEYFPTLRELVSLTSGQYATRLVSTLSASIEVLIVVSRLGVEANAYYYVPALIASGVGFFLWNMMTSFLVEASHNPGAVKHQAKTTIKMAAAVLVPSLTIGVVFAPQILEIFGPQYAAHGTTLLRLLLLALPGTAVIAFYTSFAWLDKRIWWLAARSVAGAIVFFTITLTLIDRLGIVTIGIASIATSGLFAILFLPISIRRYRSIPDDEQAASEAEDGHEIVTEPGS